MNRFKKSLVAMALVSGLALVGAPAVTSGFDIEGVQGGIGCCRGFI